MKANELKRKREEEEKAEGNLLNNNKFSPLADNNNIDDADQAGAAGAPAAATPSKSAGKQKQPPLVVKNSTDFYAVVRMVEESKCKFEPIYKLTKFGTKVTTFSCDDFDKLRGQLEERKVEFYTHQRRSERLHRIVLRGLPQLEPDEVKSLLKRDLKLEALEVHEIKRKKEATVDETPYIILFAKGYTNLRKLSEMKVVANTIIRWEAFRNKRPNVTQCRNCLHLGHGTRNCHLKGRCNKCGGPHKTGECQAQEADPKRCANCSGAHEATDRTCPKRADFIRARQPAAKPKPWKAEKGKPVPEFNLDEFPPLPGAVPGESSPQPGGTKGGTGSRAGGATKDKAAAGGGRDSAGTRSGADPKADEEEVLYTWEEVWKISLEYSARLKSCRTRSQQVAVIGYMLQKYGSK